MNRLVSSAAFVAALCAVAPLRADLAGETDAILSGLFENEEKNKSSEGKTRRRGNAKRGRQSAKGKRAERRQPPPAVAAGALAQDVPDAAPVVRKIVVATSGGPRASRLRSAILGVISRHDDLQIVSYDDVEIEAKRIGANLNSRKGRTAIALELGIFAWVDARVSEEFDAEIEVTDALNDRLSILRLRDAGRQSLVSAIRTGWWPRVGPILSNKGKLELRLALQRKLARQKLEAQRQELARQRELGRKRQIRRKQVLVAQRRLARQKLQSRQQELLRQRQITHERRIAEAREREQREEELRRQLLEQERQREIARQREAAERAQRQREAAERAEQEAWARQRAAQRRQQGSRQPALQPVYRRPGYAAGRQPAAAQPGYGTAPAGIPQPGAPPSVWPQPGSTQQGPAAK